jgi:predicted nuclease with TOPRIM domain
MSNISEQIEKILLKAGIDGTLTEDTIKYLNSKIEEAKTLRKDHVTLKAKYADLDERHSIQCEKISTLRSELKMYNDRENDLEDREKEMLKLELTAQYEAERVADHKEMFGLVFRNLETRKNLFRNGQTPSGDQYGGTVSTSENEDVTTKME